MKTIDFDLPSRGNLVAGSPAHVELREYYVEEEKGLFSSNKPFQKMLNLIAADVVSATDCFGESIAPEAVDITNWPYPDFTHALMQQRAVSDSSHFEFVLPCPECKTLVNFDVELTPEGLDTLYLEEEDELEYEDKLSFGVLKCRHVLVKNHIALDRLIAKRKTRAGKQWDKGYSLKIANQIVSLDGQKFSGVTEADQWLIKRTKSERQEITAMFRSFSFGDDYSLPLDCDECGTSKTVYMPINDREFLFREPEVERGGRRSHR